MARGSLARRREFCRHRESVVKNKTLSCLAPAGNDRYCPSRQVHSILKFVYPPHYPNWFQRRRILGEGVPWWHGAFIQHLFTLPAFYECVFAYIIYIYIYNDMNHLISTNQASTLLIIFYISHSFMLRKNCQIQGSQQYMNMHSAEHSISELVSPLSVYPRRTHVCLRTRFTETSLS